MSQVLGIKHLEELLFDGVPIFHINIVVLQGLPPDDGLVPEAHVELNELPGIVPGSNGGSFIDPFNKKTSGNCIFVLATVIQRENG